MQVSGSEVIGLSLALFLSVSHIYTASHSYRIKFINARVCVHVCVLYVLKAVWSESHCQSWTAEGGGRNKRLLALLTPHWAEWSRQLQAVI